MNDDKYHCILTQLNINCKQKIMTVSDGNEVKEGVIAYKATSCGIDMFIMHDKNRNTVDLSESTIKERRRHPKDFEFLRQVNNRAAELIEVEEYDALYRKKFGDYEYTK